MDLSTINTLQWICLLTAEDYTVWELQARRFGIRWGWAINAGESGWTAHTGSWRAGEHVPIEQKIHHFPDLLSAKAWIEQEIADQWRELRRQ